MKIAYTFPVIDIPHGGGRVVIEHCNRLTKLGHSVSLFVEKGSLDTRWYGGSISFSITKSPSLLPQQDIVVICSPHSMWYKPHMGQKVFCFVQMAEHLFRPDNKQWVELCNNWYQNQYPKIYGSRWIGEMLSGDLHYLPDGINTDHFPVERPRKMEECILIEGWECSNPAKDTDAIGPQIAANMRLRGIKVIAYGHNPIKRMKYVPNYYCYRPSIDKINDLYREATILVKATKYDSRALSPIEAATKGCVTARGIIHGDDYLIHGYNCERTTYSDDLLESVNKLIEYPSLREKYIDNFDIASWDDIIYELNTILTS